MMPASGRRLQHHLEVVDPGTLATGSGETLLIFALF